MLVGELEFAWQIATCGEVKIEILKKYIENQGNAFTPPKQSLEGACT
jgi:hypothetical protein